MRREIPLGIVVLGEGGSEGKEEGGDDLGNGNDDEEIGKRGGGVAMEEEERASVDVDSAPHVETAQYLK